MFAPKLAQRMRFQLTAEDKDKLLEEHTTSSEPLILVSPGMTEGVDLKDDLGRWQMIVKIPYAPRSSLWVKSRMEKQKRWEKWQIAISIIQSYFRTNRTETDYSVTYITDQAFDYVKSSDADFYPESVQHALHEFSPEQIAEGAHIKWVASWQKRMKGN